MEICHLAICPPPAPLLSPLWRQPYNTRPTVPCGHFCPNITPHLHSSYRFSSCIQSPVDYSLCLEMLRENKLGKSPFQTWELTWVICQGILSCGDMEHDLGWGQRIKGFQTPWLIDPRSFPPLGKNREAWDLWRTEPEKGGPVTHTEGQYWLHSHALISVRWIPRSRIDR